MTFPRYPEYKESGVEWLGKVPAHWNHGKVRYFAKLESGHTPSRNKPEYWENCTVPWFTLSDVWQIRPGLTKVVYETKEKVSELGLANSSTRLLPAGTVILSRTASVGYSAILGKPMATTQDFANWICGEKVSPEYLLAVFRAMKSEFSRMMMGSTHKTIYMPDIAELHCAIPPVSEQSKIIALLDHETARIDALVEQQKRLIELLKEKRQAVISHAVTKGLDPDVPMKDSGVEWLGEVPAHWSILPIKRDLAFLTSGSRGWASHYSDDGVAFIRIGNLTRDHIHLDMTDLQRVSVPAGEEGERTKVQEGDVLFSITAYLGSVAVVPSGFETAYVSQHVALARLFKKKLLPTWVAYVTLSEVGKNYLSSQGYGGTKIQLSLEEVANLIVTAPPLDEQDAISTFIDHETARIDALVEEGELVIELLQERRSALISAAVTGKIDVRGWQPPAGSSSPTETTQTETV